MIAAFDNKLEVLKFLTDVWKSEIDINAKDNDGWTAFMYAA